MFGRSWILAITAMLLALEMKGARAWSSWHSRFLRNAPKLNKDCRRPCVGNNSATTMHRYSSCVSSLRSVSLSSPQEKDDETEAAVTTQKRLDNQDLAVVEVPKKFVSFPFPYHHEMVLKVKSLTNLGLGTCRVEVSDEHTNSSSEWVVFVPNVIPGEIVRVRIFRNHNNYSDADLLEVLEPSPRRINEPVCKLSMACGGCQYQHMDIDFQREWKTKHVEEILDRIGGLDGIVVNPTVGTKETFGYRSKITPHYDAPRDLEIREIGFQKKGTRRLLDIPQCPIATDAINTKLTTLREETREKARSGKLKRPKRGGTLLLREADGGAVVTDPKANVTTTVSGLSFRYVAGNFFQNNPYMLPVMVNHLVRASMQPADGHRKMTHLIDCYCGSGLFCLSAASLFDVCVGIEVNGKAVREATENAVLNGITNCAFVAASAEAIFNSNDRVMTTPTPLFVRDFPRETTVVVCDPPRKGCSEEFLQQLYEFCPQRLVYMSCDPSTQARDAKSIVANGYRITSVQPLDLFPQTRHIECLIVFEKDSLLFNT